MPIRLTCGRRRGAAPIAAHFAAFDGPLILEFLERLRLFWPARPRVLRLLHPGVWAFHKHALLKTDWLAGESAGHG